MAYRVVIDNIETREEADWMLAKLMEGIPAIKDVLEAYQAQGEKGNQWRIEVEGDGPLTIPEDR